MKKHLHNNLFERLFCIFRKYASLTVLFPLIFGAYLRLYRIRDYMTFLGDEGRDVLIVKRMIVNFDIPFIGPTASVAAFFLGPLYYYLMAPFLFLFRLDPVGPAVMVAIFGILTIFLIFRIGKEWFGMHVGLICAAVYALSPLVIAQSRSSWNPNIVPFFALLYIYALYRYVKTDSLRWLFVIGLTLGAGIQFHYLFLFLYPVGFIYLLLFMKRKEIIKKVTMVIGGFLSVIFPFLGFEIKNNFPNTHTIISFLTAGKEVGYAGNPISTETDVIFRLFARLVFYFPSPDRFNLYDKNVLFLLQMGVWLIVGICLISLFTLLIKNKSKIALLLLMWFFFGCGLFVFYHRAIYDYYLVIMFPLPFLMLGYVVSLAWKTRISRVITILLLIGLLYINWQGRPFRYPPNRQVEQVRMAASKVFELSEGLPFNFALITSSNSDHAYRYFLEIWGNPPKQIENFDKDPERKTVTKQLLIICEIGECKPLGHSLWEIAGFGRAEIIGEWEVGVLKVFKLVHFSQTSE